MDEHTLNSWEEFVEAVSRLKEECERKAEESPFLSSGLLYRGQSNHKWKLENTLDRYFSKEVSLKYYYQIALAAKSKIETFTDQIWPTPTLDEYSEWLNNLDMLMLAEFKAYDYYAYLRHHGFPSPLLDWTASPYIAAFFAFNKAEESAELVSVYVYQEYSSAGKSAHGGEPIINSLGPYVRTHRRHFLQQSQYTICTVEKDDSRFYTKHEDIVERGNQDQDLLWKFNIPVSERRKALGKLSEMNINSFSLFGSEDSLLDTIATADILLKGRDI